MSIAITLWRFGIVRENSDGRRHRIKVKDVWDDFAELLAGVCPGVTCRHRMKIASLDQVVFLTAI